MILSIAVLVILVLNFSIGRKRGLIYMILRAISFVVAIIAAKAVAQFVGTHLADLFPVFDATTTNSGSALNSGNADTFFYNGIAFVIAFLIVMRIVRWLIMRLNLVSKVPVIHQVNALAGGLINLLLSYVVIFILLTVFQVFPNEWWQAQLNTSGMCQWIINDTPMLSQQVVYWLSGS
ncbi:CvpA family protein [Paucilactobacillus nenjiangensis]|jgi:uncharacterized membrane protein required for colicin V production|uniref:CvpA family protein n=1 Tax=Paucilactobacillus nenjiangensis TaxID=1296540 RepID=A0A5P1X564_9LACO|nr:CvpA family protein [Paucilactobacillus nenjiangensis]QER67819.1 CvpA family protein [Paucilactobacillus nenjiangensis]